MSMILEARKHSSSATDVDLSPLKSVIIQLDFPTFQLATSSLSRKMQ